MPAYLTFVFYPFTEMETAKQMALIRASIVARKLKEKEGTSTSALKVTGKGSSKRKSDGNDDHLLKKGSGLLVGDKQLKKLSPPKPSHGAGKVLMMAMGPSPKELFVVFSRIWNMLLRWLSQSSKRGT